LLERQRTNSLTYSEQLDNAAWLKTSGVTITANSTVSPDGSANADTITWNGSNREVAQLVAVANGVFSFYAKGSGTIYVGVAGGTQPQTIFTLTANWSRIVVPYTGTSSYVYIGNYGGATATSVDVWGAMLEAGAYGTSYVKTEAAAVTRLADAASKTGISSLIGQAEGTVFVDFIQRAVGASVVQIQLNDGSNSNRVQIEVNSSGNGVMYVFSGGGLTGQISLGAFTAGTQYKIAMVYKVNDFAVYKNGTLIGTDTSGAVPTSLTRIDLGAEVGTSYTGYELSQALVFKTRLTNAQLAELTTL
jgi:hypothetical protein